MFEADLFTASVSQSWNEVLSALRAHEHLSLYVPQCIRTFEMLSARILETRYPTPDGSGGMPPEAASGSLFDHIFQALRFDCDNFLFGMEDFSEGAAFLVRHHVTRLQRSVSILLFLWFTSPFLTCTSKVYLRLEYRLRTRELRYIHDCREEPIIYRTGAWRRNIIRTAYRPEISSQFPPR